MIRWRTKSPEESLLLLFLTVLDRTLLLDPSLELNDIIIEKLWSDNPHRTLQPSRLNSYLSPHQVQDVSQVPLSE